MSGIVHYALNFTLPTSSRALRQQYWDCCLPVQKQLKKLFPPTLLHGNCRSFENCLRYLSDKANDNKKDLKTKLHTFGQRSFTFLAPRCLEICIGRERERERERERRRRKGERGREGERERGSERATERDTYTQRSRTLEEANRKTLT